MGLFDLFKKKKEEKKGEVVAGTAAQPAAENTLPAQPAQLLAETAEEIAEKIMILIPYIKQYRSQGMLDEEIEVFLIEHAWPEHIVKRAIKNA